MGYQVQVAIPYFTAMPEDVVTNTWNFSWTGAGTPIGTNFTALRSLLVNWYNTVWSTGGAITVAAWLRPALTRFRMYNLDDPTPRVPVHDTVAALSLKQDTTTTVPPEVSVCASYKSTPIGGIALAHQRGRHYLGGLGNISVLTGGTSTFVTPAPALQSQVGGASVALLAAQGAANWQWNVYSRTLGLAFPVSNGYVDNALDTQRRRGNAPSSRTVWP